MENLFGDIFFMVFLLVAFYSLRFLYNKVSKSKKEGFFKTKKIEGYYTASSDGMTAVMFVVSIIALVMLITFVVCYFQGITDVDGNSLVPHIMMTLFLFIPVFFIFVHEKRRKIYFNKKELIIYPLLKRRVFISYDEINKVIVAKNRGIVLFTDKGRYVFDEFYSNKNKFIKILEEKKFPLIYTKYLYKKNDN